MEGIKLKVLLDEFYIAMRDLKDEKALKLKEKIENLYSKENTSEYEKLFQLMQIRFYLMVKDYQSVFNWFHVLGSERDIPEEWKHYYHLFNGILMFDNRKYQDALSSFQRAEEFPKDFFDQRDAAELKYRLAYVYFVLDDYSRSIQEALKGLEMFQKEQNEKGVALCENLIGSNSTVLGQYRAAESHYQYVRKYAEKHDDHKFKCMIYFNIGDLFSDLDLPHSAIEYLKKAFHYTWEENYIFPMRISYLLAKQYFIVENVEEACRYMDKGLKLALEHQDEEYKHLSEILKAKYQPNITDVEQIYQTGLDYFKANQLWERVRIHSEDFAIYYQNKNCFQEAVKYYDLSVQARKNIKKKGAEL